MVPRRTKDPFVSRPEVTEKQICSRDEVSHVLSIASMWWRTEVSYTLVFPQCASVWHAFLCAQHGHFYRIPAHILSLRPVGGRKRMVALGHLSLQSLQACMHI